MLGPVIEILEQIKRLPTLLLKPYYLRFNGIKRKLIAVLKALQRSMAIRAYQDTGCVDGRRQRSLQ